MPLADGTHLGQYEIIGALGAGGMGEVYKALDTKLQARLGGAAGGVAAKAGDGSVPGVPSYSMARTWFIGMVRVTLSSPAI